MKYMTMPALEKLAGVADMLELFGHDTDDRTIALGMNAPWLFMKEGERYFAGSGLARPCWIDLYLRPLGFRMTEIELPKENVPAYLRTRKTAMLPMAITKDVTHSVVLTGYAGGRYALSNIKAQDSSEPDTFSMSRPMLMRRLTEQVTVFSLEECTPSKVNFLPLLRASLDNLTAYQEDVLEAIQHTVTRGELALLGERLLHALVQDMLPMAQLTHDAELTYELRLLQHDYRHIFTRNSPNTVLLKEKLPRGSICRCIAWLRESITDQLAME
ncbi:MAG: hypothetical protein ACI4WX_09795 [Aristaeellaceae bacterium]